MSNRRVLKVSPHLVSGPSQRTSCPNALCLVGVGTTCTALVSDGVFAKNFHLTIHCPSNRCDRYFHDLDYYQSLRGSADDKSSALQGRQHFHDIFEADDVAVVQRPWPGNCVRYPRMTGYRPELADIGPVAFSRRCLHPGGMIHLRPISLVSAVWLLH